MNKLFASCFRILICSYLAFFSATLSAKDVKGSKDHPLMSRYKGAEIKAFNEIDYDEYALGVGAAKNKKVETKAVEGKITTIIYEADKTLSTFQVMKNYEAALKRNKFEKYFSCTNKNCGKYFPKYLLQGTNSENTYLPMDIYNMDDRADYKYISGKFEKKGKPVYVSLLIFKNKHNKKVFIGQEIVESKEMQLDQITIDLKSLEQAINQTGKATLHGINFEHNSAKLTEDSLNTVDILAMYLKQNSAASYFVVGHTDSNGEYAFNMKLSKERAQTIKKSLQAKGLPEKNLVAVGVAQVAPVASNKDEQGRAENRRVELVLKN